MEPPITLFGNLVLTFLSFVVPIIGIMLSLFRDGIDILTTQYENERKQTEANIKDQLKKISNDESGKINDQEINQNLKKLKGIEKTAETKLSYLNPTKQIRRLFVPLSISFVAIEASLYTLSYFSIYLTLLFLLIALTSFGNALYVLQGLTSIIIEIKKASDELKDKKEKEQKEDLFSLIQKTQKGTDYLKEVYIRIEGTDIANKKPKLALESQVKKELQISIYNHEKRMVKNIQIGIIFPIKFIVEKTEYYSVTNSAEYQIVRYNEDFIQGETNLLRQPLVVTPLEKGIFAISTFVKAENIEVTYRSFEIEVA